MILDLEEAHLREWMILRMRCYQKMMMVLKQPRVCCDIQKLAEVLSLVYVWWHLHIDMWVKT